jgi:hypothetical protein
MGIFRRNDKAKTASASVADEQGQHEHDDTALEAQEQHTEAVALEKHILDDDPMAKAALELESFSMTPGAKSLLDRAMDNLSRNNGDGIEDPDARIAIKQRAALVDAAGGDLSVVIAALCAACEGSPRDIAPTIYSLCFNILKSAVFIANLDYRRYLDPRADFDLTPYSDLREDDPSAPAGLDTAPDREFEYFRQTYGANCEDIEDIFACALEDLRLFLQLTSESFGWDPDRPIPFAFIPEGAGFTAINDPALALDNAEIKRKEGQKRRRERESARLASAALKAQELVKAAVKR